MYHKHGYVRGKERLLMTKKIIVVPGSMWNTSRREKYGICNNKKKSIRSVRKKAGSKPLTKEKSLMKLSVVCTKVCCDLPSLSI